jgi:hydroxypyruvate isomerase
MPDRRRFLTASGLGLAALAVGWNKVGLGFDSTWLTYSPDLETFWSRQPFLDRLQKLSEAGFSRYEFGRWKTKDYAAIGKKNEELALRPVIFNGSPAFKGAKWQERLIDSIALSAELAPKLGAGKISVLAPDRDDKLERSDQVDDFVDALKEAVEKVAEFDVVLVLESTRTVANRPASLVTSPEEAAAVVRSVGSDKLKFAFTIDPSTMNDGKVVDLIRQHKAQAGYYRLADFTPPAAANEARLAQILQAIHATELDESIGLSLASKVEPAAAIESIRKLDEAAKKLG